MNLVLVRMKSWLGPESLPALITNMRVYWRCRRIKSAENTAEIARTLQGQKTGSQPSLLFLSIFDASAEVSSRPGFA